MPAPSKKSTIRFRLKTGPQHQHDVIARKNPLRVSMQLWIFRYHDNTGAIDVFFLRVGCQQVDHFVRALWICSNFSSVGTGANIRWGTIVLEIEPWGADSRSILPTHMLENGHECVDCCAYIGNPLHSCKTICKSTSLRFYSPPQHNLIVSMGLPIEEKLTIASLSSGRYVPTLRLDGIFLATRSIVRPDNLMF